MSDIELVIKIPKAEYNYILKSNDSIFVDCVSKECMMYSIKNGTPLPKGHGRLGDLDALETEMVNGIKAGIYAEGYEEYGNINDMDDCVDCVKYTDTIIEADKVENMIQIENMEMPKRCTECKICVDQKTNDYGAYGKCLLQDKRVDCLAWSRDKNCPLIESEVQK